MAKQTKTVGKTTNLKKGVASHKNAQVEMFKDYQIMYNQTQESNKEKGITYHFLSNNDLEDIKKSLNDKQAKLLENAVSIIRDFNKRTFTHLHKQQVLNSIYGKEHQNIMELTDEEREYINKRRAKQAEKAAQAKEVK